MAVYGIDQGRKKMTLSEIDKTWDLIVIGGGITGAGVFREAVRIGLKVLLVEQNDFSWGTSSRSSKMVHGGLRYLKEGRFLLTRTSVHERERLLRESPGLIEPLEILVPVYSDHGPGKQALSLGLSIYGLMAHEKQHTYFESREFTAMVPGVREDKLVGGFSFYDAQVDDVRLVLRLIHEAVLAGGTALNYTQVKEILRDNKGSVYGVTLSDFETGESVEVQTGTVINATGAWAEKLHPSPKEGLHLRPLRGSHIILASDALPITRAISFIHPEDNRPIFATPWEGGILVGTTDMDHGQDLSHEPYISDEEFFYLLEGLRVHFPSLSITEDQCLSTLAGIRPVLSKGKLSPSKESRESVIWMDKGLVTVTGGKLTTFRKMAFDTLKAAKPFLPSSIRIVRSQAVFTKVPVNLSEQDMISKETWRRLYGRYGLSAADVVKDSDSRDLEKIPGTNTIWAEIRFAAKHEKIRHLSDLLLRRVRIGILTPEGGKEYMDRIEKLCQPILSWDDRKWCDEKSIYETLWKSAHRIPKR
ncbi:MAG: FAD-dependent oxidoreductase [Desulfobacterium sp.]|nr:FAD-dependent oxidoreductase [Desulfobacterium sp.]